MMWMVGIIRYLLETLRCVQLLRCSEHILVIIIVVVILILDALNGS